MRLCSRAIDRIRLRAARRLGPAAIALAGVAMLVWSWRKWPDVLVDFGHQIYTAWRLSTGAVLYTDTDYLMGPLSPYWNALLFRVFGPSFMTLAVANIVLVAILLVLLYRLLGRVGRPLATASACLAFVTLFAFGQLVGYGNFNFIAPYSHDLTHGVLLSVAAIFCLARYHSGSQVRWMAAAGLAIGLLFLTKVEVFVAGSVAAITGLVLTLWVERPGRRRLLRLVGAFVAAAAAPPLVTFGLFSLAMPARRALTQPLGHWRAALRGDIAALPFYGEGMGVGDVGASVWALLAATFGYALILGPAAVLGLMLRKPGRHRPALAGTTFVLVAAGLGLQWRGIAWLEAARPLPLFMLALGLVTLVAFVRRRRDPAAAHPLVLRICLIVFALALLLKMVLNTRIYHYGFALAMPATLLLVVALLDWVPGALDRAGGYGPVFAAAGSAALLVAVVAHLSVVDTYFRGKTLTVGRGADAFYADARGAFVNTALEQLRIRAEPGRTLAVLPEGAMINFLARRVNPSPYFHLMPVEIILHGEDHIVAAFQARPADYVMLVHKDTSEYGARFFGRDYGRKIYAWLEANYRPIVVIGARPLQNDSFGMLLLQRNEGRP
ncbi:MAG TPA: glycosyltransferase family 39 protein [Methylomirabilota bacterium]|nr:glycosyltransferase family 39 protein [Methylomirabilota bacterium]